MQIAIIGTGNIGGTLALKWAKAQHQIALGTRDVNSEKVQNIISQYPEYIRAYDVKQAVQKSKIVVLAVHPPALMEICEQIKALDLSEKLFIDTMNSISAKPSPYPTTSEALQNWLNTDRIVKAFNTTGAEHLANPQFGNEVADMFMCGNHEADKKIVEQLAKDLNPEVKIFDLGDISAATTMENFASIWVDFAFKRGMGRNFTFKILSK